MDFAFLGTVGPVLGLTLALVLLVFATDFAAVASAEDQRRGSD